MIGSKCKKTPVLVCLLFWYTFQREKMRGQGGAILNMISQEFCQLHLQLFQTPGSSVLLLTHEKGMIDASLVGLVGYAGWF